jgi:Zn ribbon nucleic-acid-binding protein
MGKLNTEGRCPKCRGNLYLDRDYNGWYEECLQCGFIKDLAVVYEHKKQTPEKVGSQNKKRDVPADD